MKITSTILITLAVLLAWAVQAYPTAPASQAAVYAGTEPYLYVTPATLAGAGVTPGWYMLPMQTVGGTSPSTMVQPYQGPYGEFVQIPSSGGGTAFVCPMDPISAWAIANPGHTNLIISMPWMDSSNAITGSLQLFVVTDIITNSSTGVIPDYNVISGSGFHNVPVPTANSNQWFTVAFTNPVPYGILTNGSGLLDLRIGNSTGTNFFSGFAKVMLQ